MEDFGFYNVSWYEKTYKNISIYDVLYKTLIDAKRLCTMFDKVNGFIRNHSGTKYLVLFGSEKYTIFDRIRYPVGLKIGVTYDDCFNYAKIKIGSFDNLSPEKTLHNAVILIRSVFNKRLSLETMISY